MTSSYDGDEEDGYLAGPTDEYGSSFPGNQPLYGPEDGEHLASGFADDQKPKILLMGLRRSGKSSIQNVVFHKMSPNETLFLESTNKITTDDITNTSCVQFKILDFPGQIDFFDPSFDTEKIFGGVGALVFVIDAQDDYIDAVTRLGETVSRVFKINPKLKFEVFIHKVDGLTDDTKIEIQRDVHERASDDLQEAAAGIPGLENVHLNSSLTSIYDHSIFEAFSKVVQKLIPQLPTLENLLNIFITNSGIEKAFLFDVSSKIYIATDYFSVDMQSYELCCDMIDIVLDISCIYGHEDDGSDHLSYFDSSSYSVIKLDNNTVLLLWQVARYLALVCILREENYDKPGLIEYNYQCFRKGLLEVFDVRNRYLQLEQRQVDQKVKQNQQVPGGKSRTLLDRATTDGVGSSSSASDDVCLLPVRKRSNDDGGPHSSTPICGGAGIIPDVDVVTNLGASRRLSGNTLQGASAAANLPGPGMRPHEPFQDLGTKTHVMSGPVGVENRRRNSGGLEGSGVAYRNNGVVGGGGELGGGLVAVTENEDWRNGGVAAGGKLRCASERRDRSEMRGSALGAPLRPLLQGQVIRTGSRSGGPALVEGAPPPVAPPIGGNTYIMTDDAGMVLVNGAANASSHS